MATYDYSSISKEIKENLTKQLKKDISSIDVSGVIKNVLGTIKLNAEDINIEGIRDVIEDGILRAFSGAKINPEKKLEIDIDDFVTLNKKDLLKRVDSLYQELEDVMFSHANQEALNKAKSNFVKAASVAFGKNFLKATDDMYSELIALLKEKNDGVVETVKDGEMIMADLGKNADKYTPDAKKMSKMFAGIQSQIAAMKEQKKAFDDLWLGMQEKIPDNLSDEKFTKLGDQATQLSKQIMRGTVDLDRASEMMRSSFENIVGISTMNAPTSNIDTAEKAVNRIGKIIGNLQYHYGNLRDLKNTHSRDNFGNMIDDLLTGMYLDRGYGYGSGGGGLFTMQNTDDMQRFSKRVNQKTFGYAIDYSQYEKLFTPENIDEAIKLHSFLSDVEAYSIKLGSGFKGFDERLKNVSFDSLYEGFQSVFKDAQMKKDEFVAFITEMSDLVKQSGQIDENFFTNIDQTLAESDNIATRLMKRLGYQGVDVHKIPEFDNADIGSVLYNVKPESIIKEFEAYEDLVKYVPKFVSEFNAAIKEAGNEEIATATADKYIDSFISRAEERTPEIEKAFEKVGDAAIEGIAKGTDSHSPSVEGEKQADNVIDGIVNEVESRLPEVENAGESMGEAIIDGVADSVEGVKDQIKELGNVVQSATIDEDNIDAILGGNIGASLGYETKADVQEEVKQTERATDSIFKKAESLEELYHQYKVLKNINRDIALYENPESYIDSGDGRKSFAAFDKKKTGSGYDDLKILKKQLLELSPLLNEVSDNVNSIFRKEFTEMFGKYFETEQAENDLHEVHQETQNISNDIEVISDDEKRLLSEIGLSYEQLVEKIKSENDEIKKGNALFEERIAYLKNGIVVDSYKGKTDSILAKTSVKDYDKIVHTHPDDKQYAGSNYFSPSDILRLYQDKKLRGHDNLSSAELFSNGQSKVLLEFNKLSNFALETFFDFYDSLNYAIGVVLGKEKEFGRIDYDNVANKDIVSAYYNEIAKWFMEALGGSLKSDQVNSDVIDNSIAELINAIAVRIQNLSKSIDFGKEGYTKQWREMIHQVFSETTDTAPASEEIVAAEQKLAEQVEKTNAVIEEQKQELAEPESANAVQEQIEQQKELQAELTKTADKFEEVQQQEEDYFADEPVVPIYTEEEVAVEEKKTEALKEQLETEKAITEETKKQQSLSEKRVDDILQRITSHPDFAKYGKAKWLEQYVDLARNTFTPIDRLYKDFLRSLEANKAKMTQATAPAKETVEPIKEVVETVKEAEEVINAPESTTPPVVEQMQEMKEVAVESADPLERLIGYVKEYQRLLLATKGAPFGFDKAMSGVVHQSDIRAGKVTQKSIKDKLREYLDKKENGASEAEIAMAFDTLAKYIHSFHNNDVAKTLFGKKQQPIYRELQDYIKRGVAAVKDRDDRDWKRSEMSGVLLRELGVKHISKQEFADMDYALENGGLVEFANKVKELYGVEIPAALLPAQEAIKKTAEETKEVVQAVDEQTEKATEVVAEVKEQPKEEEKVVEAVKEEVALQEKKTEELKEQTEEMKKQANTPQPQPTPKPQPVPQPTPRPQPVPTPVPSGGGRGGNNNPPTGGGGNNGGNGNANQPGSAANKKQIDNAIRYYKDLMKTEARFQELVARVNFGQELTPANQALLRTYQNIRDEETEIIAKIKQRSQALAEVQQHYQDIRKSEAENADARLRSEYRNEIQKLSRGVREKIDSKGKYTPESIEEISKQWAALEAKSPIDETKIELLNKYVDELKQMDKNFVKAGSETQLLKLLNDINSVISDNSKMSTELKEQFSSLGETVEESLKTGAAQDEVVQLKNRFLTLKAEMIKTGQTGKSFFAQIKNDITQASARMVATYLSFQDFIRYIRAAVSAVTDLNTALNQLKIVSGESDATLKKVSRDAYELANNLGMGTTEVVSSITEWRRLGKSIEESMILAEQAARLSTGGMMDISSATTALVSSMQAFEMKADEINKVVDQYIYLGKQLPIDNYIG